MNRLTLAVLLALLAALAGRPALAQTDNPFAAPDEMAPPPAAEPAEMVPALEPVLDEATDMAPAADMLMAPPPMAPEPMAAEAKPEPAAPPAEAPSMAAAEEAAGLTEAATTEGHETPAPPAQHWPHAGIFGHFDKPALQRGWKVYDSVCKSCHSLRLLSYRQLEGIGFTPEEVKAIAAQYEVSDGPNDEGEMFTRPAEPKDRFQSPYANDASARLANLGALPPDLSLITKAREHGADYIFAILTGFEDTPPRGFALPEGKHYNHYFPGHAIGMAPPLSDGKMEGEYKDGADTSLRASARDVAQFLTWAAEPELEARKRMGVKVMLFLLAFATIMYGLKRQIWAGVKT